MTIQFWGLPLGPLVIGLLTRGVLAPYTSWSNDVAVWFHTSLAGFHGLHLYDRPGFSYPPLWGYCLQAIGSLSHLAGIGSSFFGTDNHSLALASSRTGDFSTVVTSPAYNLLFKSVLFGFDLATGVIVLHLVALLTGDMRRARLAFTLWFLNPFVIWESAVQGAFDTIVGFAVLATVALVLDDRPFWGGVAWALGIMTKLSPAVLVLQLVIALVMTRREIAPPIRVTLLRLSTFAVGTTIGLAGLLAPELLFGSLQNLLHNVFARTESPVVVGGLSFTAVRYLKPLSWLLLWSYQNSPVLIRSTTMLQAFAIVAWGGWALLMVRRSPVFGLLTGTVGTLATFTVLSPISNPQYVLWWLSTLIVIVIVTGRGYWELGILTIGPLVFVFAILGPAAFLAPFATYTHIVPATVIGDQVIQWYVSPATLWGVYRGDDFFAPAALLSIAALVSLFIMWVRTPMKSQAMVHPPAV